MFVYSVSHTSLACTPLPPSLSLSYIYLTCVKLCFYKNRGVAVETGRSASVHFYNFTFFRRLLPHSCRTMLWCMGGGQRGQSRALAPGGGGRGSSTPPLTGERTQRDFSVFLTCRHYQSPDFFLSCRGFAKPGSS